jgi:uncharacterized protein (DUF2141 family)
MKPLSIVTGAVAIGLTLGMGGKAHAQCCTQNLIRAQLVGLSNAKGRIACAIFSSADGFPKDRSKAVQKVRAPIKNLSGTCDFKGLPAGTYAIAAFHDEDETGKMKTNFLGMPQEAFGFSDDAKPSALTPPSFSDASFSYSGGTLAVTMHAQR